MVIFVIASNKLFHCNLVFIQSGKVIEISDLVTLEKNEMFCLIGCVQDVVYCDWMAFQQVKPIRGEMEVYLFNIF